MTLGQEFNAFAVTLREDIGRAKHERDRIADKWGEVVEAVDGPIALNVCVLFPDECDRSSRCPMHEAWVEAQERMMSVLDDVSLERIKAATPVG